MQSWIGHLPRTLAAVVLGLASVLIGTVVHAHGNDERAEGQASPAATFDCAARTLTALPEPISRWTAIECLPSGQVLRQKQGWVWRYPGSFTTPVMIPAWAASPLHETYGRYFTAMSLLTLEGEEAYRLHVQLAHDVSTYRLHFGDRLEATRPRAAYTLVARNDLGGEFKLHVIYRSDQDLWAVFCMPDCRPENTFMISVQEE